MERARGIEYEATAVDSCFTFLSFRIDNFPSQSPKRHATAEITLFRQFPESRNHPDSCRSASEEDDLDRSTLLP